MVASFKVLPEEKSTWTREGHSCKRKRKWHLHLGLLAVFCRVVQVLFSHQHSSLLLALYLLESGVPNALPVWCLFAVMMWTPGPLNHPSGVDGAALCVVQLDWA